MTYEVTVKMQGVIKAIIRLTAINALVACQKAEKRMAAKRNRCQLLNGDETITIYWTGLETEARRVMV